MFSTRFLVSAFIATSFALAGPAMAQTATPRTRRAPHHIVVKLVDRAGNKVPFAFEPAAFTAVRGDTLRFVQFANTMHNVHFKRQPTGAKLGGAAISPYLTRKGQVYNVVVDSRFANGKYEIVCDPHEMLGMRAFLTVRGATGQ